MPRTFHVHVLPDAMPDLHGLQAAIKQLKFKLTLDEAYAPFETQGYLPCTLEGEDAGVDMRFARDVPGQGERTSVMTLKWGGDPREHLSALVIAAAMASSFGAEVVDPDAATVVPSTALIKQARALLEDHF